MKTLVLGGSGYIGRNIVKRLIEDPNVQEIHLIVRKKI